MNILNISQSNIIIDEITSITSLNGMITEQNVLITIVWNVLFWSLKAFSSFIKNFQGSFFRFNFVIRIFLTKKFNFTKFLKTNISFFKYFFIVGLHFCDLFFQGCDLKILKIKISFFNNLFIVGFGFGYLFNKFNQQFSYLHARVGKNGAAVLRSRLKDSLNTDSRIILSSYDGLSSFSIEITWIMIMIQ